MGDRQTHTRTHRQLFLLFPEVKLGAEHRDPSPLLRVLKRKSAKRRQTTGALKRATWAEEKIHRRRNKGEVALFLMLFMK